MLVYHIVSFLSTVIWIAELWPGPRPERRQFIRVSPPTDTVPIRTVEMEEKPGAGGAGFVGKREKPLSGKFCLTFPGRSV